MGVDSVFLILCGGNFMIEGVVSPCNSYTEWFIHLVPQLLKHPHEFWVNLGFPTTAPAGHLTDREIGRDHVSHEQHGGNNKCAG